MKLIKLSLVAALLVGSSAFAFENTKMSGDAKLFYFSDDSGAGLFDKDTAAGQAALSLGATTDLSDTVKGEAHITALSTLGLEGKLVDGVWEATNSVDDSFWFDTLNISADIGNTNATVGRMTLDTPLAWTETWSIAYNTFEAALVTNTDFADTTIVAGYVGGSNGAIENAGSPGWVVADMNTAGNTNFSQFYNGAIIAAVINNSFKPLTAQAWYYDVNTDPAAGSVTVGTTNISAYWLQADYEMDGITLGAQYAGGTATASTGGTDLDLSAYAVKLGYEMKDTFSASVSYSQVGEDVAFGGNLSGAGYSKLYTESWWTAIAGAQDTQTINVTASAPVAGLFDAAVYFVSASDSATAKTELLETTVEATKSFGNFDTMLVYVFTDYDAAGVDTDAVNSIIVNLAYNF